jgi:hypothetical protein
MIKFKLNFFFNHNRVGKYFSTKLNRREFCLKLDDILNKMSEVVLKNDEKNTGT